MSLLNIRSNRLKTHHAEQSLSVTDNCGSEYQHDASEFDYETMIDLSKDSWLGPVIVAVYFFMFFAPLRYHCGIHELTSRPGLHEYDWIAYEKYLRAGWEVFMLYVSSSYII